MIKRSECRCICHTDAVALGWIKGPMHIMPCCETCRACGKNIQYGMQDVHAETCAVQCPCQCHVQRYISHVKPCCPRMGELFNA